MSRASRTVSRRELLRRAGVGAAAIGVAGSGASKAFAFAGPHKHTGHWFSGNLSILQWVHFVPDYDTWFDKTWIKQWGREERRQRHRRPHRNTQLDARAASEVAAQSGHDIFQFLAPPAIYEDQVINHKDDRPGGREEGREDTAAREASTYNPKTKKYFGVSDNYVPDPVVWRHDLWNGIGEAPTTWEHVRKAAPKLKAAGHPIGIGMSNELDSNMANIAFMMCFGSFIQNEENRLTIKSKQTVDALKFMASIYKTGETDEIFGWNPSSNNNFLYSGKGSMILNAISATRTPEDHEAAVRRQPLDLADPGGAARAARARARDGLLRGLEVREEQARRRRSSSPISASTTSRRRRRASSTTSRASRARYPFEQDLRRSEGGHAQAARQVHDPDDDREEVHAQRRLSRDVERGDQRDLHDVPDPADVRAGGAGKDERRTTPSARRTGR